MIQAPDSLAQLEATSAGGNDRRTIDSASKPSPALAESPPSIQPDSVRSPRLYLPQLDGLRTLAFLLVFSAHAGTISPAHPQLPAVAVALAQWYQDLTWYGWTGVDLFLVLSAFLITTILIREEQQFGSIDPKLFLIRRALRICCLFLCRHHRLASLSCRYLSSRGKAGHVEVLGDHMH